MTYAEWRKTLLPYCKGKKTLLDGINDLWKVAIPQPQTLKGQQVKMILPKHFQEFVSMCLKENG